jgi:hypothetical protein
MNVHTELRESRDVRIDSLLDLEVSSFRCAACKVERWGGHVVLRLPATPLGFCLDCAKRLRLPPSLPVERHGGSSAD